MSRRRGTKRRVELNIYLCACSAIPLQDIIFSFLIVLDGILGQSVLTGDFFNRNELI